VDESWKRSSRGAALTPHRRRRRFLPAAGGVSLLDARPQGSGSSRDLQQRCGAAPESSAKAVSDEIFFVDLPNMTERRAILTAQFTGENRTLRTSLGSWRANLRVTQRGNRGSDQISHVRGIFLEKRLVTETVVQELSTSTAFGYPLRKILLPCGPGLRTGGAATAVEARGRACRGGACDAEIELHSHTFAARASSNRR